MKYLKQITAAVIILCIVLLLLPTTVQAIPPLPSSFFGTVKVNAVNVADGTLVEAVIEDQVVAKGYTQTYQGNSVYSIDVPGDEAGTAPIEGGKEGDAVHFKISGIDAVESGTWHSATNVELNLSATSETILNTPMATPSHVPTQTPITIVYATDMPTFSPTEVEATMQAVLSIEKTIQSGDKSSESSLASTEAAANSSANNPNNPQPQRTTYLILIIAAIIGVLILASLLIFELARKTNKNE